jgi:hypothetical protein
MTDKQKIKELEDKVAYYEGLPTAKFYSAVLEGLGHLTNAVKDKSLDFDTDAFAKSVFTLAKDSDKIMLALGKGIESFKQEAESTEAKGKKAEKSGTRAI